MEKCDHWVGIYYDYDCTDIVTESEVEEWDNSSARSYLTRRDDVINYFDFCPQCGESIKDLADRWEKEDEDRRKQDAVKMV